MNKDVPVVKLQIQLPSELAQFVSQAVADKEYPSVDAMMASTLEHLRSESTTETHAKIQLPPAVNVARHGFDGPKFLADMMDKLWAKK